MNAKCCCTPLGQVKATSAEVPALPTMTEIKQDHNLLKAVPWIHLRWLTARTAHVMYQQQDCAPKQNLLD